MGNLITSPGPVKGYPVVGLTTETCFDTEAMAKTMPYVVKDILLTKAMVDDIGLSSVGNTGKTFIIDSMGGIELNKKVYIHYGSSEHDSLFGAHLTSHPGYKPSGRMTWASPVKCAYSWAEWCEDEEFRECNIDNSFKFTLSDESNILTIDASNLMEIENQYATRISSGYYIKYLDWFKISEKYDGVELVMYGDSGIKSLGWDVSFNYSSWDVDSIVIWNPDIIIPYMEGDIDEV